MSSVIEALIEEQPIFHSSQWGSDPNLLVWLMEWVRPGDVSLETGSGHSTVALLALGARHTAIAPDDAEREKILAWCQEHRVDTSGLSFIAAKSQNVLPTMVLPVLDLVLIDGWHAFPIPFFDWYYTAPALRVGGLLLVDDTQIRPVRYLSDYLSADTLRWKKLAHIGHTACFVKLVDEVVDTGEWYSHPHSAREILSLRERARIAASPAWRLIRRNASRWRHRPPETNL